MKWRQSDGERVMKTLTFEFLELQLRSEKLKNKNSLRGLFAWLLRTHTPRPSCKIIEGQALESRDSRKVVLNVIAIYSESAGSCDVSWVVLLEEIVKVTHDFKPNLRTDSESFLRELV